MSKFSQTETLSFHRRGVCMNLPPKKHSIMCQVSLHCMKFAFMEQMLFDLTKPHFGTTLLKRKKTTSWNDVMQNKWFMQATKEEGANHLMFQWWMNAVCDWLVQQTYFLPSFSTKSRQCLVTHSTVCMSLSVYYLHSTPLHSTHELECSQMW